jgi:signal transduction histidine kinase
MPNDLTPYAIFLSVFIFINVAIYFVIQLNAKEKIFRELFIYWITVLLVFLSEGIVIKGRLGLSLIFLINFLPISIMASFILRTYQYKFKFKFYSVAIPMAVLLSVLLDRANAPFQVTSAPIVLVNIAPFLEAIYISMFLHKDEAGVTEKIIGAFLSIYGIFCCINYGLNRFEPTLTEYIIGFGTAFVGYLFYSILLPVYVIQQINRKRTDHLEAMVLERTRELTESKHEKEKLLRVLVHDISNPLQAVMYKVGQLRKSPRLGDEEIEKADKSLKNLNSIREIITHVREYECVLSGTRTLNLGEVNIKECLDEIESMFSDRFREKDIDFKIHNKLPESATVMVDRTSFIHSVAANLISNALKFSLPNSEVIIACYKKEERIIIEVIDRGIGISKDSLDKIFDIGVMTSRIGTLGESGTGFGLPIVKAYTSMYGGRITATSSQEKENSGTTFCLTLPGLAESNSSSQTFLH